jgi:hypothetical protein
VSWGRVIGATALVGSVSVLVALLCGRGERPGIDGTLSQSVESDRLPAVSFRGPRPLNLDVSRSHAPLRDEVKMDIGGGPRAALAGSAVELLRDAVARREHQAIARALDEVVARGDQSVPELDRVLQSGADDDTKEFAAAALARIGTASAVGALLRAIRTATNNLRDNLLEELRKISSPEASGALAECLREMADMVLHRECRRVLLGIESPLPAESLVREFQRSTTDHERIALAFAISMIRSHAAIPVLIEAGRARDDLLATRSFMALARIGGDSGLEALSTLEADPINQNGERATELRKAIELASISSRGR